MQKKIFMVSMFFLVLGGLTLGSSLFLKKDILSSVFKNYASAICLVIGISALIVGFSRDTYLPFLGESVIPCIVLKEHIPENATHFAKVKVHPGAKVMYWAAEPENDDLPKLNDWRKAYMGFRNAGVVIGDKNGIATLRFRKPQPYYVPVKGNLQAHVHYRTCITDGVVGRVETIKVDEIGEGLNEKVREEELEKAIKQKIEEEIVESMANEVDQVPDSMEEKEEEEEEMEMEAFAPAEFSNAEPPQIPTNDNTLYYLAAETEKNRIQDVETGLDESPQAAGTDYEKAFLMSIPQ